MSTLKASAGTNTTITWATRQSIIYLSRQSAPYATLGGIASKDARPTACMATPSPRKTRSLPGTAPGIAESAAGNTTGIADLVALTTGKRPTPSGGEPMGETKIEWTHFSFNPWEGCQKVGPGCDHCYAEARDHRFTGGAHWGPHASRRRTSAANWLKPHTWNRAAARTQRGIVTGSGTGTHNGKRERGDGKLPCGKPAARHRDVDAFEG